MNWLLLCHNYHSHHHHHQQQQQQQPRHRNNNNSHSHILGSKFRMSSTKAATASIHWLFHTILLVVMMTTTILNRRPHACCERSIIVAAWNTPRLVQQQQSRRRRHLILRRQVQPYTTTATATTMKITDTVWTKPTFRNWKSQFCYSSSCFSSTSLLASSSVSSSVSSSSSSSSNGVVVQPVQHHQLVPLPCTPYDDGIRPYQITTPIYYVNDKPHIGHAYTSTACDVISRFMRLSGRSVCFVTGTDEHGQKVQQSAEKQNIPPLEFVDQVSQNFRDLLSLLNIDNDIFIRTTQTDHTMAVQHLWNVLKDRGYIYKGNYEGWYSVRDECFYNESELVEGKAPTGAEVEWVAKEESYFFKLSAFQDQLLQYYDNHPYFIAPDGRRNEILSFVRGGLRDLSISRTSFTWGVPVPDDPEHIVYVWIDALTNYLSALGYPNMDDKVASFWPCALHVVGKDIIRFHAVYWPAMLMAADLPLPKRIFAHGWWTKDGQKISKSIGNVIDPLELVDKYGVDATRFFLMSEVNFGNDGDFSDRAMILKVNSNLANELGNLCQRTLSMVHKNCDATVPTIGPYTDADLALLQSVEGLWTRAATAMSTQAIHKYVEVMVQQIVAANKYIDEMAPWVLRKTDPQRMATVLYVIMEVLRYAAILYQPLIPESANKILDQLTVPADERSFFHLNDAHSIKQGTSIAKPEGIFPRIELPSSETTVESPATVA